MTECGGMGHSANHNCTAGDRLSTLEQIHIKSEVILMRRINMHLIQPND